MTVSLERGPQNFGMHRTPLFHNKDWHALDPHQKSLLRRGPDGGRRNSSVFVRWRLQYKWLGQAGRTCADDARCSRNVGLVYTCTFGDWDGSGIHGVPACVLVIYCKHRLKIMRNTHSQLFVVKSPPQRLPLILPPVNLGLN